MACGRGGSGATGASLDDTGEAAAGNDYTVSGVQSQQFGGNVDPNNFAGQSNPDGNVQSSTAGGASAGNGAAPSSSSVSGIGGFGGLSFEELALPASLLSRLPVMTRPYCGYHDVRFGPLAGAVQLLNFNPRTAAGHVLSLWPSLRHCTGIGIKVFIVDLSSGKVVDLPCHENGNGTCWKETFHVPMRSSPSWNVSVEDVRPIVGGRGPYLLVYAWLHNTVGTCNGSEKSSFGLAAYLRKATAPARSSAGCPTFP